MSDEKNKNNSAIDKVVMGAIIGTAIGAAIGVSTAPKKGSETRDIIKDKSKNIGSLAKETGVGFFKLAKRLVFGKKKDKAPDMKEMKKIPHEMEIIPPEYVDRD